MKILNLGSETESGLNLHFTDTPAPIHGKSRSFEAVGLISIALRPTSFGNVSVSRPALCFSPLIVKLPNWSGPVVTPRNRRQYALKGSSLEKRNSRVKQVNGLTNSATPHLSHIDA